MVVMATLILMSEGQGRRKMCIFDPKADTCTDIGDKYRMFATEGCAQIGGQCGFSETRKTRQCRCNMPYDV